MASYDFKTYKIKRRKRQRPFEPSGLMLAMLEALIAKNQPKPDSGLLGKIASPFGSFLGDVKDAATGLPFGLYNLGKGAGSDLKDLLQDQSFTGGSDLYKIGQDVKAGYEHNYGDIRDALGVSLLDIGTDPVQAKKDFFDNSNWTEFGRKFVQHPLGYLLDATALAGGTANVAAKIGKTGLLGKSARLDTLPGKAHLSYRTSSGVDMGKPLEIMLSDRPSKRLSQKAILGLQKKVPTVFGKDVPLITGNWKYRRADIKERHRGKVEDEAIRIRLDSADRKLRRVFKGDALPVATAIAHHAEAPNTSTAERSASVVKAAEQERLLIVKDKTLTPKQRQNALKAIDYSAEAIPKAITDSARFTELVLNPPDTKQGRAIKRYQAAYAEAIEFDSKTRGLDPHDDSLERSIVEDRGEAYLEPLSREAQLNPVPGTSSPSPPSQNGLKGPSWIDPKTLPLTRGMDYSHDMRSAFSALGSLRRSNKPVTSHSLASRMGIGLEDSTAYLTHLEQIGAVKKLNLRAGNKLQYRILDYNAIRRAKRKSDNMAQSFGSEVVDDFVSDIVETMRGGKSRKTRRTDIHTLSIAELDKVTPQTVSADLNRLSEELYIRSAKPVGKLFRKELKPSRIPHEYDQFFRSFERYVGKDKIKEWKEVGQELVETFEKHGTFDRLFQYSVTPRTISKVVEGSVISSHMKRGIAGLKDQAIKVPRGQSVPKGMVFLTKAEHPDHFFTTNPTSALVESDHYLAVPKHMIDQLRHEVRADRNWILTNARKANYLMKTMLLSMRPGFVTGNVVGNTALVLAGDPAAFGRLMSGLPSRNRFASQKSNLHESLQQNFPEHSVTFGDEMKEDAFLEGKVPDNVQKVMHFGFRVSTMFENWLREGVMLSSSMRHSQVFKDTYKKTRGPNSVRYNKSFKAAMADDPDFQAKVSTSIDDVMGDYHSYSRHEDLFRLVIPFYGWYRHIMRATVNLVQERPVVAAALFHTGILGHEEWEQFQEELGMNFPEFMDTYLPVDTPFGDFLETRNLNPWATVGELTSLQGLVSGDPGSAHSAGAMFLTPFATSGIEALTGKSLLTGAESDGTGFGLLPDYVNNLVGDVPPVKAGEQFAGAGFNLLGLNSTETPGPEDLLTKNFSLKEQRPKMLTNEFPNWLSSYLGAPIKNVSPEGAMATAQLLGENEDEGYFKAPDLLDMMNPIKKYKKKIKSDKNKALKMSLLAELLRGTSVE